MATAKRDPVHWGQFVSLSRRFQRSVHLERDADNLVWLDDYVLTPLVSSTIERIGSGLTSDATSRAWSITGPYGSGKSALALFLSQLLSVPEAAEAKRARRVFDRGASSLSKSLFTRGGPLHGTKGLVPVRATGERAPLELVLVRALHDSAESFWSGRGAKPDVYWDVLNALRLLNSGKALGTRNVVKLFEEMTAKVVSSNRSGRGLLVLLDEAGKTLEHAALQPSAGDVHLLQELAEAASRSGDTPIVLVVLLHQSFEQYASRLSSVQRNEWSKVQGRFEDIAFHEANDQLLRLMAAAIRREGMPRGWEKEITQRARETAKLVSGHRPNRQCAELLDAVLPLHPVTALALGPLFKSRLAQNERSLFAFLSSTEPMGFQRFLAEPRGTDRAPLLYAIDELYDYVQLSLGGRLYGKQARHWSMIETALRRLPETADGLDARVVKTVGLLSALGDAHDLRPSGKLVEAALTEPGLVTAEQVHDALARLKAASILVFRKYLDAYQLWEGSDLDLDGLVDHARQESAVLSSLSNRLAKVAPPRPLVARKHLFETGTLRYFELRYADEALLDEGLAPGDIDADGLIYLIILAGDGAAPSLAKRLEQPLIWLGIDEPESKPVVVALPESTAELRDFAVELGALEWVQTHTPALRDDPAARHELEARIAHATHMLRDRLAALAGGRAPCRWYRRGRQIDVESSQSLARLLSRICDEVYASAPQIHNELLNRASLSSAAAAARRTLLAGMIERGAEERLGIAGFPPEYSMYRSLLEASGMHRASRNGWAIGPPRGSLQPAWQEVQRMLDDSEQMRLRIDVVYRALTMPPFGMKAGPLPVLLLAALLDGQNEIAVYEDGVFVPQLTVPVVERLLRSPERFEMQRFRVVGARRTFFQKLATMLAGDGVTDATVLDVVRLLVRLVGRLTDYAKNTQQISATAKAVREALLRAREPAPLLFRQLPVACGHDPLHGKGRRARADVEEFVDTLRSALLELQQAYPQLLNGVEQSLAEAFSLPTSFDGMRRELVLRARRLLPAAFDSKLKGFLMRVSDDVLDRESWLVSVATLLGGKPPASWRDDDIEQARLSLALIRRRFQGLEALLLDGGAATLADGTELIRIAIAQPGAGECEQVVAVREEDADRARSVEAKLRSVVNASLGELSSDVVLAALANVARGMISALDQDDTPRQLRVLQ